MHRYALLLGAALAAAALLAADKDDEAKKELKKFEGTWVMVSGERDGEKIADEHVQKSKITWKGGEAEVLTPHQSKDVIKGTVTIDPTKKPKEMDWKRSTGPDAGKTMRAIYEFMGDDQYRVCFAPGDKDRPKEFSTKPGSGHTLHVWKRVK
jgi:uncharacterized protein (TIGR03067 family)